MTHRDLVIVDDKGAEVATAKASPDIWPKSAALYVTEVEVDAPPAAGLVKWSAKAPPADLPIEAEESQPRLPHAEGSVAFDIRFVVPPEFKVTVEAYDKDKQTPLAGAVVVMHPYKVLTDERGIAEVRVAKGNYKLFVTRQKYSNFDTSVDVTADVSTRAELSVAPPPGHDRE
jgi:hypothetical protein